MGIPTFYHTLSTMSTLMLADDGTGIIFNPGETRKCVNVRFGRYDHVAMFQLTLSTTDQSVVVTDAAIDVTIVPEFIFTLDGLSLEIVLQGLRVDNVRRGIIKLKWRVLCNSL